MRTEAEVRAKLKVMGKYIKVQSFGQDVPEEARKAYSIANYEAVRALAWVLGREPVPRYLCTTCLIQHLGLRCPSCGGEKEI